jgi:hypothetical protein
MERGRGGDGRSRRRTLATVPASSKIEKPLTANAVYRFGQNTRDVVTGVSDRDLLRFVIFEPFVNSVENRARRIDTY